MKWIPVSERLPEAEKEVLIFIANGYAKWVCIGVSDMHDGEWYNMNEDGDACPLEVKDVVTHWMPLPPPPEDE